MDVTGFVSAATIEVINLEEQNSISHPSASNSKPVIDWVLCNSIALAEESSTFAKLEQACLSWEGGKFIAGAVVNLLELCCFKAKRLEEPFNHLELIANIKIRN